ncbi:MAG: carboxypeptidase-like regulatory domain-containing protein [Bacteroidales bacterium]|nr:carboxypeptidase-like regulatory domain-containing protein [Bacteroidales bacterium]MDD4822817.1 carboxypeptidase-like regulatory domain-containing protein [Bacteroidales bacterium]
MKHLIPLFILLLALGSCTNEEGLGGSSTIEGYVYSVYVYDDLKKDTFPACMEDVQILYSDLTELDRAKTGPTGKYKFEYLREGKYSLCTYSKMPANDYNKPVMTSMKVSGNDHTYKADTLYIQDGKSIGMTYLTGTIMIRYYNKSTNDLIREIPAFDQARVYIENKADASSLQDARTNADGQFFFSRLQPGEYRISIPNERMDETVASVSFDITISEDLKITFDGTLMDGHDIGTVPVRVNV